MTIPRQFRRFRILGLALFWAACSANKSCAASDFLDVTVSAGVDYTHWQPEGVTQPFYMTGGAAAGDYDGDGWVDLFVTRLDNTDILYRNLGNGSFQDVSSTAGFTQSLNTNGATWGDVDNDGDLDLYLTSVLNPPGEWRFYLYINNGNGTFTEDAVNRGADLSSAYAPQGFSSTMGDYNADGYLDIFTTEWGIAGTANTRLLRNRGKAAPGMFEDVTFAAGVDMNVGSTSGISLGFSPTFIDIDKDGHTDLVIAADFGNSRLYWNNGDGTFLDGTVAAGVGGDENGMGSAIGDYDGDGDLDWFVSSIYEPNAVCPCNNWGITGNRLYRNDGLRTFTDVTDTAGVRDGRWGWGSAFLDYDNDGDLDLIHTNGYDYPGVTEDDAYFNDDPTRFWSNSNGVFSEVATQVGITDNGSGKGLLTFDYDKDGDLDLFIVNNSGMPNLYRNDIGNANDWLQVETIGTMSNSDGIGAQITVIPDDTMPGVFQYQEITAGSNYLGQSEAIAHFGLGSAAGTIDQVIVYWPVSGISQIYQAVSPNMRLVVTEPLEADWNHDGVVNGDDLTIWYSNFGLQGGATHSDGDSNLDDAVTGIDFLIWQRQYGSIQANSASIATPEPGSILLLITGAALLTCITNRSIRR